MNENKLRELKRELEKLKVLKEGGILGGLLWELTQRTSMAKGEKGDTPQKGLDYMTESEMNRMIDDMARKVQSLIKLPKDGERGEQGRQGKDGHDGRDGIDGRDGKDGLDGADGSPDVPEVIRQKLENLEDEEKLPIKAIKDLTEELEKLKKQKQTPVYVGGGSGAGGHIVKAHDLSASLDGLTKTFSLPAFWRVISVHLSSFPNILRETTDYTTDAGAMTITFTSEIDAGSVLSAGQTLIVIFSE